MYTCSLFYQSKVLYLCLQQVQTSKYTRKHVALDAEHQSCSIHKVHMQSYGQADQDITPGKFIGPASLTQIL